MVEASCAQPLNPYLEFVRGEEDIHLTCEFNSVNPKDIKIQVFDDGVEISVINSGVERFKRLFTSKRRLKDNPQINFLNGILEVRIPYNDRLY